MAEELQRREKKRKASNSKKLKRENFRFMPQTTKTAKGKIRKARRPEAEQAQGKQAQAQSQSQESSQPSKLSKLLPKKPLPEHPSLEMRSSESQ